jgi:branched-chain amino acid transport system substrate-binding protein
LVLLWSCTSVRPVAKLGILAPFEGLYRRTGYDLLAAVRVAISEVGPEQADLLPLALDDSNDPVRTAQKLLQDPDLQIIIGPLALEPLLQITTVLNQRPLRWFSPLAIGTTGFLPPANQAQALAALVAAVAEATQRQGAQRLILAGNSAVATIQWPKPFALPVVALDEPTKIAPGDAVFWLGDAATAADFLTHLRISQPNVPFWLGTQAEDPVFAERAGPRNTVYWVAWVDDGYESWVQAHNPNPTTVYTYQAYAAAKQAIDQMTSNKVTKQAVWQIRLFTLLPDGQSRPLVQK